MSSSIREDGKGSARAGKSQLGKLRILQTAKKQDLEQNALLQMYVGLFRGGGRFQSSI